MGMCFFPKVGGRKICAPGCVRFSQYGPAQTSLRLRRFSQHTELGRSQLLFFNLYYKLVGTPPPFFRHYEIMGFAQYF